MRPVTPGPGGVTPGRDRAVRAPLSREATLPSPKLLAWMVGTAIAVVIGMQHYQARKGQ